MEARRKHTKLSTQTHQTLVRSESDLTSSPWALDHIQYRASGSTRRLELSFPDPFAPSLAVPIDNIQELALATVSDLRALHLSPTRDTIISDTLDVHISVEGLIRDLQQSAVFNRIVSTLRGAQGGRSVSDKKRIASAENGKKGGRPRKVSVAAGATDMSAKPGLS
jgi:hypothetical protein